MFSTIFVTARPLTKYFLHKSNSYHTIISNYKYFPNFMRTRFVRKNIFKKETITKYINYCTRGELKNLDVKTNVKNNVILYKFDRPKHFQKMHYLAISFFFGWSFVAYMVYETISFSDLFDRNKWKESLEKYSMRLTFFICAVILGPLFYVLIYVLTVRSVKYIVLNKGGEKITFVSYHPWKKEVVQTVPLNQVTCKTTRKDVGHYLPIKVQENYTHFLIDKKGKFYNEELFEFTAGLQRELK